VKSHEGYFQPIARSGRADFPRNGPSHDSTLEWMTVTSDDAPPAAEPFRSRYAGPEPPLPGRDGAGYVDVWRAGYAPSFPDETAEREERRPWSTSTHRTFERTGQVTHTAHVERWWRLDAWRSEWRGGLRFFRWEHADPERIVTELLGETPIHYQIEGGEMVAYGPWHLTIKGFESEPGRRVLATWSVRWVRASTPVIERWEHLLEHHVLSSYEREHVLVGGSEQARLLERGASELWRVGGSERVWLGASEWMAAGGSETLWMGASERALGGASAFFYMGASERIGASERLGASERGLGGSEQRLSERWATRPEGK
jgi:hypothetical protein